MAPDYDAIFDDMGDAFAVAYGRTAPFTMTSKERMYALWQATRYVEQARLRGDIVECGVWCGDSSVLAALARGAARPIWLFDTYEGMPPPSSRDRQWSGERAADRLAVQERVPGAVNDWAFATLDDVEQPMASIDYPRELLRFVKGRVEETIPLQCPVAISLLHLDTDWYESTLYELEHLWRRLSVGGVLIIDDYGHRPGAREATDEFFAAQGIAVLLDRIDYTGRIAVKLPD